MDTCTHTRTGIVTSDPQNLPLRNGGKYASTPVCDLPQCITDAKAWVIRVTHGKPAFHVLDKAVES